MIEAGSLIRSLSGRSAARNFHTYVINEIGHAIVTGSFPVGSVLASDAQMMEQYGVSRTVLREALKTLEAKGLVEARPKVGTRVSPKSRWSFFDPQVLAWHFHATPDAGFYESLFQVRIALELPSSALASKHRTAEDIRLMKYWLHQMTTAGESLEQFGLACLEIHRIKAECSRNVLMRSVVGVFELTLALALTAESGPGGGAYRRESIALLEALVTALEQGEEAAASRAVLDIIDRDRTQVTKRLRQTAT